ncbi:hypothetical protein LI328DRAFT_134593 [Trichoderma asperelloides]|nr:hypothetical protein LI328DRAFT_134593 [Trichoderma asperelloides]
MASAAVPASSRRDICLLLCCFQRLAGLHPSQTDRSPWDGAIDVVSQLLCVRTEVATGMDPPSCLPCSGCGGAFEDRRCKVPRLRSIQNEEITQSQSSWIPDE